jgi:hypothetical protein
MKKVLIATTTNQLLFKQTIMAKTKIKEKRVEVISPDGFTIEFDKSSYKNMATALASFKEWAKRYEGQGYYSSASYGRIPLADLQDCCRFREI